MKKNLLLTLALMLASFAGAIAQDWSVTLGAAEGLPGKSVSKDGVTLKYYKSGIITADKPIKTLRFTCAGNTTNNKPNGNNFRLMLSELNVYSAEDLSKELSYTVTSNADHNTLSGGFDGQGLRALYDGKYNNYFSSMSAANGAVTEYHYLELTFEKKITRFVIEWGGKQGSGEVPSVVVLTEGGVAAEAYTDRSSSFSEDKITTIEGLENAGYFTICGNAPSTYDTYNNVTGEKTSEEPLPGSGPMYVTLGEVYAKEPTIDYLTQLIPVGDGTYYIYFPMQKKYLDGNATDNAFNEAQNGWQYATVHLEKAAKVTLKSLANGDFEMSYVTKKDDVDYKVYIGADPRTGKMKIFSQVNKVDLEALGWCEGFGLVCAFNWSFYGAEYSAPTWAKEYEIGNVYLTIKELKKVVEDDGTVADVIASLEGSMANIEDMDESEIEEVIAGAKEEISSFIYDAASNEYDEMEGEWDKWKRNSKTSFVATCYPMTAYNEYIAPGAALIEGILESDAAYEIIEDVTNYFRNKEANIAAFEASKYALQALPLEYRNLNRGDMTIEVALVEPVNGFRWTLMENHSNKTNNAGYPFTSFTELEIFDADGNKVALTEDLITTNSLQGGEGTIAGLVDGITKAEDYQGEAPYGWYWHAIWGGGAHNPDGEAYLDIRFPSGVELSQFTIKGYCRSGQEHNAPKTAVISEYGREHDSTGEEVNPYTVTLGEKVVDLTQIKDGGLYVLQGNLNVNMSENASEPRFYAGVAPSNNTAENLDETNVYMFKKVGDCWNILSLNDGKYWINAPEYGESNISLYKAVAANVKLVASKNLENTFVIYSKIDTTLSASFNWVDENDETNVVKIDSTGVKASAVVYMDWDGGLASRPCYSPIPGEVDPQFVEKLAGNEHLKITSAAGDYLHFNKTNGEGEWTIYEVTMNDAYFAYLSALVQEVNKLNIVPGVNPGCIMADAETVTTFENAKAEATIAVNENNRNSAEKLSTDLISVVEELSNYERVGFDPETVYRIESGLPKYEQNTWVTRSVYADAETSTLKWTATPNSFEEENQEFLFNIIPVDEKINTQYSLNVAEKNLGKVFIIKLLNQDKFAGAHDNATNNFLVTPQPVAYWINNLAACNFEVKTVANNRYWHTEGHAEGNGYGGRLVNWNNGTNLYTASSWTFINMSAEDIVDAQDWSVTLGAAEGLPGETILKDGGSIKYYKSSIITPDKPIKTLRFTCAGNSTNNKPNGNNYRMMLSELNVYSADDLTKELSYTVISNADHNTLSTNSDGQGLKALYDGKYNNYFSSMSSSEGAVTEYHYLELTFEQEISRFVIEWGGKQASGEAPSVVVLTEGGVAAEPYSDRVLSFSNKKITAIDALEDGYFTICGNAPSTYDTYNYENGEKTNEEPLPGSGPMYVTLGDVYAKEPTIDYLTQLIPVGDGTYYIYFPMQKRYLSGNATDNAFNDAQNGWQYATSDITKAAKVTLTPLANGDFEMSYVINKDNVKYKVYIGADPRTGKMKIFSKAKKIALETNKWCEGFSFVCAFNWSFYGAEYNAPLWIKEYELGNVYLTLKELQKVVEDDGTIAGVIADLEDVIAYLNEWENSYIERAIAKAKTSVSNFIKNLATEEYNNMEAQWGIWKLNSKEEFKANYYPMSTYNQYIEPGSSLITEIKNTNDCYVYIESLIEYLKNKEANIVAFEASKYTLHSLPLEYAANENEIALGIDNGSAYVWEQSIGLDKKVNGFRITFLETNVGSAGGGGKYKGFPMVALGELEIYNPNGEKIALTSSDITTNSQETSEGAMENLVDGNNVTFWHSIWGNGTMSPESEVYLDIKLPAETEIDIFKLKIVGRNNKSLSPKHIVISEYNKAYNDEDEIIVENPYNVKIGAQVTAPSQLKDGGLYIIQGNLNVNKEEGAAKPRYYAGREPYSTNATVAADTPCVYMFKKVGDCWNILSLSNAKYWDKGSYFKDAGLTIYQTKAANVKFVNSNNIENAMVIYSDIDTTLEASYKWTAQDNSVSFNINNTTINTKALVYIDWDGGVATRPCYSPIPGEIDPRYAGMFIGHEALLVSSNAGESLHFNKTNGEGEWNIYEATMDDAYFAYLSALVQEVDKLKLIQGVNPGCIKINAETEATFKNAKTAANVAVNENKRNNAEKLSTDLIAAVEELNNSERVGFDAEAVYRIESAFQEFENKTWETRSIYAGNENLAWTVTPENFEDENQEFLFNIIEITDSIASEHGISQNMVGNAYIIKNIGKDKYIGADWSYADHGVAHLIVNLEACEYNIKNGDDQMWHAESHNSGNGRTGNLCYYNAGINSASSWTFINMSEENEGGDTTEISDLVVEGDEVVAVRYFTAAGNAIPAPAKGLNIVVTVYANGIIETKKVIVK